MPINRGIAATIIVHPHFGIFIKGNELVLSQLTQRDFTQEIILIKRGKNVVTLQMTKMSILNMHAFVTCL